MQTFRDVMLTIMAFLVSVVCAGLIYMGLSAGAALSQIGSTPEPTISVNTDDLLPDDETVPPECVGAEPLPDDC